MVTEAPALPRVGAFRYLASASVGARLTGTSPRERKKIPATLGRREGQNPVIFPSLVPRRRAIDGSDGAYVALALPQT
jgi:hypothetical protein